MMVLLRVVGQLQATIAQQKRSARGHKRQMNRLQS
jgi:hypothetical protein